MNDPIDQFKQAIAAAGLTPPDVILDDGAINRFATNGRRGDDSGWYCLHSDGIAAGSFGDWRTGLTSTWCSKSDTTMTEAERQANRERVQAMQRQRDDDLAQRQQQAAQDASKRVTAAMPCTQHAYTTRKGIKPHGVKIEDDKLLIPMYDTTGAVCSVQTIAPDGSKLFMPGGRVKGCYFSIGKPDGSVIVCEGFATGASIHEATGRAVAIAFNAGNMGAVALALHEKYPAFKIIMAADDDHLTAGNPGMTKARAAALAVNGWLGVPSFLADRGDKDTDFNDLHQLAGLAAVKACIDNAVMVTAGAADWPELLPLIDRVDPQEYPLDALPDSVRCAVQEVAGFVKAPIPLIAQSALTALSLAIQAHTDVERAEKLTGPCSLFMLAIADSGERKSSCDGYFTKAIRDYEEREHEKAKPLIKAYQTELDAWEAQRSGIKEKIKALAKDGKPNAAQINQLHDLDDDKPLPPKVPRLIYGDATPEALAYSLAKQWPSGGVLSNEAGVVFGGHAMSNDSAMRNMALLNQLWDGWLNATDRKTAESFSALAARLTMGLQVQEATLRAFFTNTKGLARGTGFLARFQVSWPQSTQGTRFFTEAPANWPALATFNSRLTLILDRPAPIDPMNGHLRPGMLTLAPDAKAAWVEFHNQIEAELSTGGELFDVRDVASKTADNAARMAALFHIFNGSIGQIDIDAMESAARITLWHLTESKRFLGELAMPPELANPMRLETWMLDWCRREGTDKVSTRDIQQFGPGGLRDKPAYTEAVKELADLGRARQVQDGKKKSVQINPALLAGAA